MKCVYVQRARGSLLGPFAFGDLPVRLSIPSASHPVSAALRVAGTGATTGGSLTWFYSYKKEVTPLGTG